MKNLIALVGGILILLGISIVVPFGSTLDASVIPSPIVEIGEATINNPEDIAEYLMENYNEEGTLSQEQVL